MANLKPSKGKIIVFGIVFFCPVAGVVYQFLHYLIGLRRLGYDVYYIEDSTRLVYDPEINEMSQNATGNIRRIAPILEAYGFTDRWAYLGIGPTQCFGLSSDAVLTLYHEADAFFNVTGSQEIREEHLHCPRRIYIESDPFTTQVGLDQANASTVNQICHHDTLFSFGENLGAEDCLVPAGDYQWLPTRQPVILDLWPASGPDSGRYTTVTSWYSKGKDIEYRGETFFWTKDREFKRFLDLPKRSASQFELAVGADDDVRALLASNGWRYIDSVPLSNDISAYRRYIQQSRGEFTVARDQYTRPRTGWFSDRSACYLAAGRPVITQQTGFDKFLPTGAGLFGFDSMDDILDAVDRIESNYTRHCEAARQIAEEYFSAEKVISSIIDRAGL